MRNYIFFKIEHKLDQFRKTRKKRNLKGKFVDALDELKDIRENGLNKTIVLITLILVIVFLYIIDFDLTIFTTQ